MERGSLPFVGNLARIILCSLVCLSMVAAADLQLPVRGREEPRLVAVDEMMVSFLNRNHVPGAAVAITRQGRLVYAKGFGWADLREKRPVEPDALFRIASLTKSITAAAVLKLAESHAISLQQPAFPYLGITPFLPPGTSVDPRLDRITIWHLLHHSGGFNRESTFDPALYSLEMARSLHVPLPVKPNQIIQYMTGRPLDFDPGTETSYSNFGYLVLGRVIEKASGESYEDYVKAKILEPLGITDMQLGHTFPEGRAPGEVSYYSARNPKSGPSAFGPGLRPYPYGVWCLESMDAFAGWLASPIDLVTFANALDRPEASPILKEESIQLLFARPEVTGYGPDGQMKDLYVGCGWYIRKGSDGRRVAYHRGLLDGISTLLVRDSNGFDYAVFFNSDSDSHGKELAVLIDPLLEDTIRSIQEWPTYNLFDEFRK